MFLYATACYMVFDASAGLLRTANAGHPAPLLFPAADEPVQWLDDALLRGPALAIDEEAAYQTMEKILKPGDTVAMYTDGLFEAESDDGEEFGDDRLLHAAESAAGLPLDQIFSVLTRAAADFSGAKGFSDDVCLVGLTFHKPM
jgi:sigma-B regulation protein RsbU (phosphoserine phosphatase)